jgi:Domain of unknown function (DUF4424)
MRLTIALALALAALTLAMPSRANDSEAAVSLGGIELVANSAVSMDAEDLFISKDEVRVRYRYTNRTPRDVTLTIAFPVPVIKASEAAWYGDQMVPDFTALKFKTTVDGKPVTLSAVERAEIGGRDVTRRLRTLGWPLRWITGSGEVPDFVRKLTPAERATYRQEGLLRAAPDDAAELFPAWDLVTHVTRKQLFPARRTVEVRHSYAPMIGGSVAGALYPAVRGDAADHLKRYCVDKTFLAAFDRRNAARAKASENPLPYGETWISYILSSGRNWKGPIGSFRLVVDKGKPENLVSFCLAGVKKISPTQFEVRRRNFEPRGDLDVLIAQWYEEGE